MEDNKDERESMVQLRLHVDEDSANFVLCLELQKGGSNLIMLAEADGKTKMADDKLHAKLKDKANEETAAKLRPAIASGLLDKFGRPKGNEQPQPEAKPK